jgi:hypothetical protein
MKYGETTNPMSRIQSAAWKAAFDEEATAASYAQARAGLLKMMCSATLAVGGESVDDILQGAITATLSGQRPWTPGMCPLWRHLRDVGRDRVKALRRHARRSVSIDHLDDTPDADRVEQCLSIQSRDLGQWLEALDEIRRVIQAGRSADRPEHRAHALRSRLRALLLRLNDIDDHPNTEEEEHLHD